VDLRGPLEAGTGLPVVLENAANACALSEMWFGQRENTRDLAIVTVSEGIGTGIVVNGQIMNGASGLAGEFGHVTIDEQGPVCKCGNRGCWEVFASNTAAISYYRQITSHRKPMDPALPKPTFDDLLRLAELGDPRASQALDRMAKYLGAGIAMLIAGLEPAAIVIVGEVTRAWSRVGPIITETVARHNPLQRKVQIFPADDALQPRLRGTVALILQKHFGAPAVA